MELVTTNSKNDQVREIVGRKFRELRDEIRDILVDHHKNEPKQITHKQSKLADELLSLRKRLKLAKVGNYDKLFEIAEFKIARVSDELYKLVKSGKIGSSEYNAYNIRLENIFNGDNREFTMKGIRKSFDEFIFRVSDELELGEIIE